MSLRRIIRDGRIVSDDCRHLADDAPVPEAGTFTVSFVRWCKERDVLQARVTELGVRLPNDLDVDDVINELNEVEQIALEFPKFGDGRALSQAHVLRQRHGFKGELRAIGDVQRDQLWQMYRCGINAFELRPDHSIEEALKAFSEYSVTYQPAIDTSQSIFLRRRTAG